MSPLALQRVIEEFVTRDGTEASDADVKVAEVRLLLDRGEAEIHYDPETETCSIAVVG